MSRHQLVTRWSLVAASAVAFVVGASAPRLVGAISDRFAVHASGQDPVQQQEPPDPAAGRGGRGGGQAPAPRPYV